MRGSSPRCRVELINGEIFEMTPIDPWHAGVVNRLVHRFVTDLGERAVVHMQNPVGLEARRNSNQTSCCPSRARTGPDRPPAGRRAFSRRGRQHVPPVRPPARASAVCRASVSEVWIVNRQADAVEVFRGPSGGSYTEEEIRRRGRFLPPAAFPDLRLSVDDVLGWRKFGSAIARRTAMLSEHQDPAQLPPAGH